MTIKVIKPFNDVENDMIRRDIGDTIDVDERRGNHLIAYGYAIKSKPKKKEKAVEADKEVVKADKEALI